MFVFLIGHVNQMAITRINILKDKSQEIIRSLGTPRFYQRVCDLRISYRDLAICRKNTLK